LPVAAPFPAACRGCKAFGRGNETATVASPFEENVIKRKRARESGWPVKASRK